MDAIKIIGIVGCMLVANEMANAEIPDLKKLFVDEGSLTKLQPYLEALYVLPSGERLINRLDELKDCRLKLVIKDTPSAGTSFENTIAVSEISDDKVEMTLSPYNPVCQVHIPILYKNGSGFCVQDVRVPAYIAVGHELIHFIHKSEALNSGQRLEDINNWNSHRANRRSIATLYGYNPKEYGISDDENSDDGKSGDSSGDEMDPLDKGLSKFEEESEAFFSGFLNAWGNEKAYEELRTITGIECNTLSSGTLESFRFAKEELDISERHLLCDYFAKNPTGKLKEGVFITRWTHALRREDVKDESFSLVENWLAREITLPSAD